MTGAMWWEPQVLRQGLLSDLGCATSISALTCHRHGPPLRHPHTRRASTPAETKVLQPLTSFFKDSMRLVDECEKPDRKGACGPAASRAVACAQWDVPPGSNGTRPPSRRRVCMHSRSQSSCKWPLSPAWASSGWGCWGSSSSASTSKSTACWWGEASVYVCGEATGTAPLNLAVPADCSWQHCGATRRTPLGLAWPTRYGSRGGGGGAPAHKRHAP